MGNSYQHRPQAIEARLLAGLCGSGGCVKCVLTTLGGPDGWRKACDGNPLGLTALLLELKRDELPRPA